MRGKCLIKPSLEPNDGSCHPLPHLQMEGRGRQCMEGYTKKDCVTKVMEPYAAATNQMNFTHLSGPLIATPDLFCYAMFPRNKSFLYIKNRSLLYYPNSR